MGISNSEKMLGAHLDEKLVDKFTAQVDERGYKIKKAVAAAIRLWTDLPVEYQARILEGSLDSTALLDLVGKVVDDRIEAGRAAGGRLRKRKRPPKD